jgi:hypothetical protein
LTSPPASRRPSGNGKGPRDEGVGGAHVTR